MKRDDEAAVITTQAPPRDERVMYDCLRHAITDTQNMIRAYDTKAQVLLALLTFTVGAMSRIIDAGELDGHLIVTAIAGVVVSVALAAFVLYPRVPKVDERGQAHQPAETYYLSPPLLAMGLDPLIERVRKTDWLAELVYELRTLGRIRQRKAFWFKWAFIATAITVTGLYSLVFVEKLA